MTMRRFGRVLLLTALWILAWGELSAANVLSGIAVASALLVAFPPPRAGSQHLRIRPLGIARLAWYIVVQLVAANVLMTTEVLRRRSTMAPGLVRHRLAVPSEHVVTLMTSIISLSPGTMTVDVGDDSDEIQVHFLFLHDVDAARASLVHLEELATGAITADSLSEPGAP
jgi:multicomponent Na+:H+ antiporter subunit E